MFSRPRRRGRGAPHARATAAAATATATATSTLIEHLEHRRLLSTTYALIDTLKDSVPQTFQEYGSSLASNGSHVLIGVPGTDGGIGEAHLVDAATGNILHTFGNPNSDANDRFGASVTFAGGDVVIGAPGENGGRGAAYRFDISGTPGVTYAVGGSAAGSQFGANVVGLANGNVLIQTANDHSSTGGGLVSEYDSSGAHVGDFVSPDSDNFDTFGQAIAISGSDVFISSAATDSVYRFDIATHAHQQTYANVAFAGTEFGTSLAIVGDDLAVGAPSDSTVTAGAGAVHLIDTSTGGVIRTYDNPSPEPFEQFGRSLAVLGDDLVIGAIGATTPMEFVDPDTNEPFTTPIPVGAAYVVDVATEQLEAEIANPTPQNPETSTSVTFFDTFGDRVAVAGGKIFVSDLSDDVGADDSGAVFVFQEDAGPTNQPPVANAGADVSVNENVTVTLDASGSSDPDGAADIVEYAWDLNNDGTYETIQQSVSVTSDAPGARTVGLQVTDAAGETSTDSVTVTFVDVVPTADAGADQSVETGETVTLSGTGSNAAGDAIADYEWDLNNDGVFETTGQTVSTSFASAGSYTVNFRVRDDDGQLSAADSVTILVTAPPPPPPGSATVTPEGDLNVQGTSGDDLIEVNPSVSGVAVLINGVVVGSFAPTRNILIFGGDGNDDLKIHVNITLPGEIYGGSGDDDIRGGGGNDYLRWDAGNDRIRARGAFDIALGDEGDDLVAGGDDRDILIGGTGADKIVGNADEDILVAGFTAYDDDREALEAIQDEWLRTDIGFDARVTHLIFGGGLNFAFTLNADDLNGIVTTFDDGLRDTLTGGQASDWFIFNATSGVLDKVTDLRDADFASDLEFINS